MAAENARMPALTNNQAVLQGKLDEVTGRWEMLATRAAL